MMLICIYKTQKLNLAKGLVCESAQKMMKFFAIVAVLWCINAKGIQLHLSGIPYFLCTFTMPSKFYSYISNLFA